MTAPRIESLDAHGPVYGPQEGDDLPGLVLLHGSEGPMAGWAHRFAAILAVQGVMVLPLGYGEGDYWGVSRIEAVDISGVPETVAALAGHPRCRGAGLFGWSLGGALALLVAGIEGRADRILFAGAHAPLDVAPAAFDIDTLRAQGRPAAIDPDAPPAFAWPGEDARLASGTPIDIARYPGPVFLSVGTADTVVDPSATRRLAARLDMAGNAATLFEAEGQDHALDFETEPQLWARLIDFIGRTT